MEKILAFQLEEEEMWKLKNIASQMKICLILVERKAYRQTIEDLLEQKSNILVPEYIEINAKTQIKESMVIMEGFVEKRFDKLLKLLKDRGVKIDYKAVVTPFNRKWNVLQFYLEMERERAAYTKREQTYS